VSEHYVYEGEYYVGMKHGWGRIDYNDGSSYIGNFKYDKCYGKGQFVDARGTIYSGNYFDNDDARGTITYWDKRFVGWWWDNIPTVGEMVYDNGEWYIGQLNKDGVWNGYGKLIQKSCTITGYWENDQYIGSVSINWKNSGTYDLDLIDDYVCVNY